MCISSELPNGVAKIYIVFYVRTAASYRWNNQNLANILLFASFGYFNNLTFLRHVTTQPFRLDISKRNTWNNNFWFCSMKMQILLFRAEKQNYPFFAWIFFFFSSNIYSFSCLFIFDFHEEKTEVNRRSNTFCFFRYEKPIFLYLIYGI